MLPFGKGFHAKYVMERPICTACNQRLCAVNYYRDGIAHYRTRCDPCIKKKRRVKPAVARWQSAGYKKKATCDVCGFKSLFTSQILVYHVDGDLDNIAISNLRSICLNCVEVVKRKDVNWKRGDLEID